MQTDVTDDTLSYHIRAHIFIFIGHIFCDLSQNRIKLKFLLLLEDLENVHTYSRGSACLAYLYHHLCRGTSPGTSDVAGCLKLLQVLIYLTNFNLTKLLTFISKRLKVVVIF